MNNQWKMVNKQMANLLHGIILAKHEQAGRMGGEYYQFQISNTTDQLLNTE